MIVNPAVNILKPPTPPRLRQKIYIDEYNLPVLPKGLVIHGHRSYRIGELLGEGGTAAVYEAFDWASGKKVALKISLSDRYLMTSAEVLTNLKLPKHPNLGQLIDIGNVWLTGQQQPDLNFMVFKYIGERTLFDKLCEDGPFTLIDALKVVDKICSALLAAQKTGIWVHADIKLENIALQNKTDEPVLIDFVLPEIAGLDYLIGTSHYMSPEQIKGKDLDCRSDIYSLGLMLYELISGESPHKGEKTKELKREKHTSFSFIVSSRNHKLALQEKNIFHGLLNKMTHLSPRMRHQSIEELQQEVRALMTELGQEQQQTRPAQGEIIGIRGRQLTMKVEPDQLKVGAIQPADSAIDEAEAG